MICNGGEGEIDTRGQGWGKVPISIRMQLWDQGIDDIGDAKLREEGEEDHL